MSIPGSPVTAGWCVTASGGSAVLRMMLRTSFSLIFTWTTPGGAAALREATGATVYAQRDDAAFIQGDERIQSIYKLGVIGRAASLAPVTAERLTDVPHVKVDRPLADGEVIPVLGGIQVIHSPGHTPGSACFFWPDRGILFTGDTIINTYHFLTLPTIGFSCDFDRAADSADHVAGLFAYEMVSLLCPGHGPFVSDYAGERLRRFRRRLARR